MFKRHLELLVSNNLKQLFYNHWQLYITDEKLKLSIYLSIHVIITIQEELKIILLSIKKKCIVERTEEKRTNYFNNSIYTRARSFSSHRRKSSFVAKDHRPRLA